MTKAEQNNENRTAIIQSVFTPLSSGYKNEKCHVCGEFAVGAVVVENSQPQTKGRRVFCCTGCFWKWTKALIANMNRGGRLDRVTDWNWPCDKNLYPKGPPLPLGGTYVDE